MFVIVSLREKSIIKMFINGSYYEYCLQYSVFTTPTTPLVKITRPADDTIVGKVDSYC